MIPDQKEGRGNFDLITCQGRTPERGRFNIEELTEDEILYYWALLQQEADTRAKEARKQWRVIPGGKATSNTQLEADGQISWMF
ncbi:hypothetical protein [Endozoicomonas sp. YOMI1]|uniref:hypothetical protein n=1 Tax=Endozoicomonas sp. YOMI1 TaxID=2828739 RepID=UPI0021487CB1|nr:hypothetical protein [Endozoicomonas sp. YOMI1]